MKVIDLIAGARPNFMKIAPLLHAYEQNDLASNTFSFRLIHTGQHFDANMSDLFFDQLNIRKPDVHLNCGGGSQAEQTAKIMISYECLLNETKSDLCIVVGDVTSTMACTIVAKKMNIQVAHIEAGIRSGDISMPEEVNRIVTDALSDYFFTTTENAGKNLLREGKVLESIFLVGNTMIDTLYANIERFSKPSLWENFDLSSKSYFLLTLHRPSNVDSQEKLENLISLVLNNIGDYPLIFPVHPRTRKNLSEKIIKHPKLKIVDPLGYLEFMYLVNSSVGVITDSGGITEETTVLSIPCITLRNSTERPETVEIGTNILVGDNNDLLVKSLLSIIAGNWKKGAIPNFWDGKTANRIINHLQKILL